MDAGAAQFQHFLANRIEDGEIENLVPLVTEIPKRRFARLQAIGANQFAGLQVVDHEMVTEGIERVDVQATPFRRGKPLFQFQVEDLIAKALAFDQILWGL
jgi:hypothetical protein